MVEIIALLNF